jgi:hypothetical protein
MDTRAGLDDVEKRKLLALQGLELRSLGRPARSKSLYRLRYLGSLWSGSTFNAIRELLLLLLQTTTAGILLLLPLLHLLLLTATINNNKSVS